MEYGFTTLEPKALEQIEGNDFEEFCEELLRFERNARHPGAEVAGTAPRSTGDAGKDLRLTTTTAPTVAKQLFPDAITEDFIGETYFSCKGGTDWAAAVLHDLRVQTAPLDALVAGGHFTVFTHRKVDLKKQTEAFANAASGRKRTRAKAAKVKKGAKSSKTTVKATFMAALIGILARRLDDERSVVLPDLAARIHVYDGSHITAFLKRHRPSISFRFAIRIGIRRLDYLVSLDQWERELAERGFPQYVPDPARTSAIDALRVIMTSVSAAPRDRATWVHGAPGVGKSRMVLEALRKHPQLKEFERRIVVARSEVEGSNAISAGIVEHSSDVILVVDECPAERVGEVSATFLSHSSPGVAVLVMIGPRPRPDQTPSASLLSLPVGPLDDGACRALVVSTLGIEPASEQPLVERVLHLCEGYPWSAVLIAKALRGDRNALPEGATHWDACELVLAGKQSAPLSSWHQEALRYARAILAVMLTDGIDWREIDEQAMTRIAHGVGLPSSAELLSAAEECDVRGLLRRRLKWKYKYVTPNNVARQVAIHLLAHPHHAARSIRAYCRELMSRLHEQLAVLDVPAHILETLADDELDALDEDPPNLARLSRGDPGGATLMFVARHRPARTAAMLRRVVEKASTAEWTGNDQARFVLGSVLTDLARRRAGFDDAEPALYKLAVDEQRLGVVQPVNAWRSLFLVHLNPTYFAYLDRLARVESRLPVADAVAKCVVIRALEVSISQHESRLGGDPLDGPWLEPTRLEAKEAGESAWQMLFRMLDDPAPVVASAARQAILKHLRSGVRTGVGAVPLGLLLNALSSWPAEEHAKVREVADLVSQYDMRWLDQDAIAKAAHERLLELLTPQSFRGRLIDAVGRWRPWHGKTSANASEEFLTALDEGLAREGLQAEVPLKAELEWLESEAAPRGVQFMAAAGRVDLSCVLLPALEERTRSGRGHDQAAAYLSGFAATGREGEVDALLRRWRASPELALPIFLTIWRIGPSDERISWLIEDVEGGRLPANVFRWLMVGSWGARANTGSLRSLARVLLATNELAAQAAALSMVLARMDTALEAVVELIDVLAELVASLAKIKDPDTMLAYEWELGCKRLQDAGRIQAVIDAAMEALGSSESVGFADRVWTVLHPLFATHGTDIWVALTRILDGSNDVESVLVDTRAGGLMQHVAPADVIRWIGSDRSRQIAVSEMCGAYEVPLNPLARALIAKYGAQSIVASVIAGRAHSTPSAVSSLAQFARGQLANARDWARDSDAEVAQWGARMVKELEQAAEEFDAHEEYEARRRG